MTGNPVTIRSTKRTIVLLAVLALLVSLAPLATTARPAMATPVADSPETYAVCGRVFPDPHAYWAPGLGEDTPHPGAGVSPWAKGNAACAARHYISWDGAISGLEFMADELPGLRDYVDLIDLSRTDAFDHVLDEEFGEGYSEGNGEELGQREELPLFLVRVTAPGTEAEIAERDHFVWSLSAHGIETAGREGGLRAIEDLATWAHHEPDRLILETFDETITTEGGREARNLTAGEVLENSVSYFMLSNPDGWRRGDVEQGNSAFQRFNGNGMDLNRDWPEIGYTDPEFTPWSETESSSYGKALQAISDEWTGGIDLHGMVAANAFSYTLIGGTERAYDKNERTMEFVEQAWRDAESRLQWSSMIKPNSAPEQCVEFSGVAPNGDTHLPPGEQCDQRSYGVQYGTIWDTIDYTATGAIGNWFDSPIGLDADGIDNEMMLSHLGNCGVGTCYVPEAEQLHVDGNKSLIYSMLNFSLQPVSSTDGFGFDLDGSNVAYLVNPDRLVDPGVTVKAAPEGATDRPDVAGTANTSALGDTVLATWSVDNDGDGLNALGDPVSDPTASQYYVAGISGSTRYANVTSQSVHLASTNVQYLDPDSGQWIERPTYGSDGAVYRVAGDHSDWNFPADGDYRLVASTLAEPMRLTWELEFRTEPVWDDKVQAGYEATNMKFFEDLSGQLAAGTTLTAVDVEAVLAGDRDLNDFDTVVVADGVLFRGDDAADLPYANGGAAQGLIDLGAENPDVDGTLAALKGFAEAGGNVVLTDNSMAALPALTGLAPATVRNQRVYAGALLLGDSGYDHPLVAGTNNPGAVEGPGGRRQSVEPLPIGFSIGGDNMPQWEVSVTGLADVGGTAAAHDEGWATVAEIPVGAGVVRSFGAVLTFPTTAYYHPNGISSYGLTDHGYTVMDNLMTYQNPAQSSTPDLADDEIQWRASGTPTRIMVDGSSDLPLDFIE